ncbi:MAG: ABC transporter ATP-binding protein [Bdellovibrionales bacterium]|nr:ABC transporter ATP-binding protein [Bdellovibrionales bacterium]
MLDSGQTIVAEPNNQGVPATLIKNPFLHYFKKHKRSFFAGIFSLIGTNLTDALPPLLIGYSIDQITRGESIDSIALTLAALIVATAFLAWFRYLWRVYWGRFNHSVAEDLRNHIYDKYTDLGPTFFSKTSVGELMSLINNDVNLFRMAIGPGVLVLLDSVIVLCIIPPLMISISPDWTWKSLILIPLIPFVVRSLMTKIREGYKKQQDRFAELSGVSQEIVSGIRVIKSYAQEDNQTALYNKISKRYQFSSDHVAKLDSLFAPTMELGVTTGSVILLVVGAPEVMSGAVSVGAFFAFYQYIQRMIWPMEAIGLGVNFIQKGRGSFDRIRELLQTESDVPDEGQIPLKTFQSLEFEQVTFTYPGADAPALKNLSFQLNRGETLGIVGAIGSGKSTLIELLCRQYQISEGKIKINGLPIENYKREDLMNLFSVVPQDAFLFSRKLKDNIAFGDRQWSFSQVEGAVRYVNFEDEVEKIPDGYDAVLGEKGVNLSGGQKQRLTMARAIIRQSDFLILDDSLSAVDAETEKKILEEMNAQEHSSKTAIIISHRLASLRKATNTLVLKNGELEDFGNHHQLLKSSSTYQSLYSLQTEVSQ